MTGSHSKPWHEPEKWYSPPIYWEDEIQNRITAEDREVRFIDCTLAEGEDMLGKHFSWNEWLDLTEMLDDLGVPVITTPYVPAGERYFENYEDYLSAIRDRGVEADIQYKTVSIAFPLEENGWKDEAEKLFELDFDSYQFMGTYPKTDIWDDFEGEGVISKEQIYNSIDRSLKYIVDRKRDLGIDDRDIVYGIRYAFDHQLDSLVEIAGRAVDAGADGVYLFDSTGQANPPVSRLVSSRIKDRTDGADLYVQHHNDLGLATGAIFAAAEGGADYLDASIAGIGERGGTAALEEVAVSLESYGWHTGIDLSKLNEVADYVKTAMDLEFSPHKPIIGSQINKEEGIGHQYPGDPSESPAGIATKVLDRPFEGVVGYNVLNKYRRAGSGTDREDLVWGALKEWGYEVTEDDVEKLDERILDQLFARGTISLEDLRTIAEVSLEENE